MGNCGVPCVCGMKPPNIPLLVYKHVLSCWERAWLGSQSVWVSTSKGEGEGEASVVCEEKLNTGRKRKEALVETLHFLTWVFCQLPLYVFPLGCGRGGIAVSCCGAWGRSEQGGVRCGVLDAGSRWRSQV